MQLRNVVLLGVLGLGACVVGDVDPDELPLNEDEPANDPTALAGGMPDALCDAAHPVKLTVKMTGHDGYSVHSTVGVDLADDHESVDREGNPDTNKIAYPIVLNYNTSYDFDGMPAGTRGEVRSWTGCVGAKVTRIYLEAYPRELAGKTNRTKYGETVYQYIPIDGAGSYDVDLRFPVVTDWAVSHGLAGGDTGDIFGHVMCHGAPAVPDHAHLRVWSAQPGSACGIRAYSASAEPSTAATYTFKAIAGGQCNAPSQPVAAYIRGNCDGRYFEVKKSVNVTSNKTLPLNIELTTGINRGPARSY